MIRSVFISVLVLHGLIHVIGFIKTFNRNITNHPTKNSTKARGILWLVSAILFILTAILFFYKNDSWWISASSAILISQYLIFTKWDSAKFGTFANLVILSVTITGYGTWSFGRKYKTEVLTHLKQTVSIPDSILAEEDIQFLPAPVKKHLHTTRSIGKPKVKDFKIRFTGQIRKDEQSEWMPFTSEQYNFIHASTRLFFMNATMKHLPVAGFHYFKNGNAFMDIRLLSLFKVQYQSGKEMGIAETVTFFNDMCCMAPATLIDKRIKWMEVDSNKVKATFTNNNITISAWLYFNDKGELVNFISNDRYAVSENNTMKRTPWSTPLKNYKIFKGYYLAGYADAIYKYPQGDLFYGNFNLVDIEYNNTR